MKLKPRIKEKRWSVKKEMEIYKLWEKEKVYKFRRKPKKPIFTIDTPPPYASGRWHVGGATHYAQIDMIARAARMLGFNVLFPIGMDRNGLPVEVAVEKEHKIKMWETDREEFLKLCKEFLDRVEGEIIKISKRLGLSGDFENYYQTDSVEYRKLTQTTFIELWKKGLIYEDVKPNNYCPVCQTTIADAEIEYREFLTELVYIKFKVKETREKIEIATTRPELLCACRAVLVHPEDERYLSLHGKHAIVPIYKKEVPIIPHPAAKMEFGTGIMMVCSYGDYADIRLFRELKLKPVDAIDDKGKMKEVAGEYKGLTVEECRKKIVKDLKKLGLVSKVEKVMHKTPTCWRSHNPIEFIRMKEYYLKQVEFIKKLKKLIENIKFHPPEHKQLLIDWMNSVSIDWAISRRRYYGTEIPIWYCKKCGTPHVPKPGKYYQPWKEKAPFKKCRKCGNKEFVGETRTFDTWFDSSISPLFITGYGKDKELFRKAFPCGIRPQGKDIVRTWLYYTLLRVFQLTRKPAFKHIRISGMGLDEKGRAMHKSWGNVVYPEPILEQYGADAFRLWGASESSLGSDYRYSEERVEGSFKFLTKLWNIARFVSSFPQVRKVKLTSTDKWILAELSKLIEECIEGYEEFDFFVPATKIREFVWNVYAPHYLEMVKQRAYGYGFSKEEQKSAWFTLHTSLQVILKLLAPITPFITDYIWREMYSKKSIHLEEFPKPKWKSKLIKLTESIMEFNSFVWGMKKEKGLPLKERISVDIPKELKIFEKDLKAMHKIV